MRAPFPWFGGKRKVSSQVWAALGDVDNYVEPFGGSLAVLLERPHKGRRVETVNDADGYVANFWRALQADPEQVAHYADWPVNENDLFARHMWLVARKDTLLTDLHADPEFYDARVAGWWVWGICSWIGSGWCSGDGPWLVDDGEARKLPHLGDAGRGVNRKLPHLGDAGRGVNRQLPHLGDAGRGVLAYFLELATRLRYVRVCSGDWARTVTRGALAHGNQIGIFLDPPYLGDVRCNNLYGADDHYVANDVREWAIDHGDDPRFRIVLAGYTPEHDHLIPDAWRRVYWSSSSAYSTTAAAKRGDGNHVNRHKETLWLSPHCLDPHPTLFGEEA